jgi:[acyl-carrier-protein] S-malonyltransferase
MNKCTFIFPGQGSQFVGMGKELFTNFKEAKQVYEEVDDALQENLSKIIFDGTEEELRQTKNTQPALMATSIATLEVLKLITGKNIDELCSFVAGHSLGEFTALCASGAISLSDVSRILRIRGQSMQEAVPESVGKMAAILGSSIAEMQEEIASFTNLGNLCQIANDNCPGQIVISGNSNAVEQVVMQCQKNGKKAIFLNVSAPFHCDLIASVKPILSSALDSITVQRPKVPIVLNVTATQTTDPEVIKKQLVEQVTKTVLWNDSMNYLIGEGIKKFYEIGAGKVLTGMLKRINRDVEATAINSEGDIQAQFC